MSSIGQAAGAVIGGAIGFVATGGSPAGALKGASIGAAIGQAIDPADLPGFDGPRLSDTTEQTSGFGVGLNEVDGKIRVPGHVFWIENNARKEVVHKEDTGGKGGGGSQETTTYEYFGTFAVMLTDHQVQSIERLWDSLGLVLNTTGTDADTAYATSDVFPLAHLYNPGSEAQLKSSLQTSPSPGPKGQIRLYPGFDDQMPDPRIEADLGVGSAPAYRGRAYLVFYDWPLPQEYAQSIAGVQASAEVVRSSSAGAAVLLNETRVTTPAGFVDPACQYLNKTLSRLYFANGAPLPDTPPTAFGVMNVGPYGSEPRGFAVGSDAADPLSAVNQIGGKGITDTDIGQIGLSDAVNLISAFPGRLSIGSAKFARSGSAGAGIWYATTTSNILYFGDEVTDSNNSLALGAQCFDVAIDEDGNCIALFSNSIKVYDDTLSLIRTIDTTGIPGVGGTFTTDAVWLRYDAPTLYVCRSAGHNHPENVYPFDMVTETAGTLVTLRDISALYSTPSSSFVNINIEGSIITRFSSYFASSPGFDALVEHFRMPTPSGSGEDLASVVRRRLESSEYIESSDIDVTDLTGTVRGYKTVGVGTVRGQIEPLMLAYNFDIIQDGYQIKAVMRGGSSVVTIDADDLGAREFGSQAIPALQSGREMDSQLPYKTAVKHLDATRDYDVNEQYSQPRAGSKSANTQEIDLPIVFTATEAAGIAETIWARRWLERNNFAIKLPQTYRNIRATDVITVPTTAATYELLLKRVSYNLDGTVEIEAVSNDSAIYTPNAVGSDGVASTTTVTFGGNSKTYLLDIPLIQDEFNKAGFVAAMTGYSDSWPGGVLLKSIDTGQTYQAVQGYSGEVLSGIVPTALPDHTAFVIDRTNSLTVQLNNSGATLPSITETTMMLGQHWCAYGAHGRWEIIRYADSVDNGDGTFTLSTLIRGSKGTEQYTSTHADDDDFIFISDADAAFIGENINNLNVELLYKGATFGQDIDLVTAKTFAYTGVNLKPLSPVQLDASLSGADWVIVWKRRSRLENSYWTTGVAIPLGESSESYEIDILDGATVVRTLTATSQTVTYTEAQQITDFGSGQSTITFRVYQMSETIGRGYVAEATI